MNEFVATVAGFVVASIIPAAVLSILQHFGQMRIGSVLYTFVLAYPFSAFFTVVLGLPAFLLLRRFRPGHWWSVSIVGILLGVLVVIILSSANFSDPDARIFLVYGLTAALSTLVFWWIWRQGATKAKIGNGLPFANPDANSSEVQ